MRISDLVRALTDLRPQRFYDRALVWSTILYSVVAGDRKPYYYVLGYPKSGTNWVCSMLSAYQGIPVYEFWNTRLPGLQPCILHMHRILPFKSVRDRTLYVLRDGRDIVVSDYFRTMHDAADDPDVRTRVERYLGAGFDPDQTRENLAAFIRYQIERTVSSVDYVTHVQTALKNGYLVVKYEDLTRDAVDALSEPVQKLFKAPLRRDDLEAAVELYSFAAVTGREPGSEDRSDFHRKGVSGDWKNYFHQDAARIYDAYAGETLIQCGYEKDHDWVLGCPT